jgi:hypothetical protein
MAVQGVVEPKSTANVQVIMQVNRSDQNELMQVASRGNSRIQLSVGSD